MKKKQLLLAVLAFVMVLGASIGSTSAYFTTYAKARGGIPIMLGDRTEIGEKFSQWTKHVQVYSNEGFYDIYVRVSATGPSVYELEYLTADDSWTAETDENGKVWYVYNDIVKPKQDTTVLDIVIHNVPESATQANNFDVTVYYESVPVTYDSDGNPLPADWSLAEGGN